MPARGSRRSWSSVSALIAALAPGAAAIAAPSPYDLDTGPDDAEQRAARHEAAAATAPAPDAARHLAQACWWRALRVVDPDLRVAPCPRARELARQGPLDAQLALDEISAELAIWRFDLARAEHGATSVLARAGELDLAAPEGRPVRRAQVLLAFVQLVAGRWEEGLASARRGVALAEAAGDRVVLALAEQALCYHHVEVRSEAEGREACARALATAIGLGDWYLELQARVWMARLDATHARGSPRALEGYRRAYELSKRPGGELRRVSSACSLSNSLVETGRLDEARRVLEEAEREASPGARASFRWLLAKAWGVLLLAEGDPARAAAALELATTAPEHAIVIWAWRTLALARGDLGDLAGREQALERAIAALEEERLNVAGATARAAMFDWHAELYSALAAVRWRREGAAAAARALETAEQGRARGLLDAVAGRERPGESAAPLDAAGIQAALSDGDVLVEYASADDVVLAFVVTRTSLAVVPLPGAGGRAALAARADFFRQLVAQGAGEGALAGPAARLGADLVAPALARAPAGTRTLVLVPDGELLDLPFDVLRVDGAPLVERHDIAVLPSASLLVARAGAGVREPSVLVVGAPAGAGRAPLPAVAVEIGVLRDLFGERATVLAGADATAAAVTAAAARPHAVLHVAGHAEVDRARPLESALVLAPGGGDPRWRAGDIATRRVAAELVVLSACATATGALDPGEGSLSLARAFLVAGAAATVATLWDIVDASGPVIAEGIYRRLAAGSDLVAALAGAKRAARAGGAPPRTWAAFVTTGAPHTRVSIVAAPEPSRALRRSLPAVALAASLALAVVLVWRRRLALALALAAATAALALVVVVGRGRPAVALRDSAPAAALELEIRDGEARFAPHPGADEHVLHAADAAGVPIAAPSPRLPASAAWAWVEARQNGVTVARSRIVSVGDGR